MPMHELLNRTYWIGCFHLCMSFVHSLLQDAACGMLSAVLLLLEREVGGVKADLLPPG